MAVRESSAKWAGDLQNGEGSMRLGSGSYEGTYTYASRFESGAGTNPKAMARRMRGVFPMFLVILSKRARSSSSPPPKFFRRRPENHAHRTFYVGDCRESMKTFRNSLNRQSKVVQCPRRSRRLICAWQLAWPDADDRSIDGGAVESGSPYGCTEFA